MQSITLQTSDSAITSSDVLGRLSFAASAESDGGAAILQVGSIYAMAEGTFSASANPASIVFATSASDTSEYQDRLKISHEGHLLPITNNSYDLGSDSLRFKDLHVNGFYLGGTSVTSTATELNLLDGVTAITLGSANELLVVGSDGTSIVSDGTLAVDTSNNRLGINQTSPEVTLHMTGESAQSAQIRMEQYNDTADAPDIRSRRYRGTVGSPSAVQAGDYLFRSNHEYYNGTALVVGGAFAFDNTNNAARTQFSVAVDTDGTGANPAGSNGQFKIDGNNSGAITFNNAYTFPTSDGSANQVLQTDGAGSLSFATVSGGGGEANEFSFKTISVAGQSDVVADTTTDTLTLAAGSNVTITTNASTDTITIAATDTNTQLSTEEVQDIAGPLVATGGTKTLISVTYDDANGNMDFVVDNDLANYDNSSSGFITATLTNEEVMDIAGPLVATGGTKTLITVTYDDANNNMDFVVDNDLSNYDNSTSGFITATLTDEQVQDIAGGMFTGNTETRITATYQDSDGTIDLVVDDDLNNYSNTNSKFIDSNTTGGADLVSAIVVCTQAEYNALTPDSTTLYFIKD